MLATRKMANICNVIFIKNGIDSHEQSVKNAIHIAINVILYTTPEDLFIKFSKIIFTDFKYNISKEIIQYNFVNFLK